MKCDKCDKKERINLLLIYSDNKILTTYYLCLLCSKKYDFIEKFIEIFKKFRDVLL